MTLCMHIPDAPLAMDDTTIDLLVYVIDMVDQEFPVEVPQVDILVLRLVQRDLMIQRSPMQLTLN